MKSIFLNFNNVSFTYESMSYKLFSNISAHFGIGWTGIIGANVGI